MKNGHLLNERPKPPSSAGCVQGVRESWTGVLRLALEAAKVLPLEKLAKKEEEKFHSTVRLREDEYEKMEMLKKRLNYNGNGIFRTGIYLANRELQEHKMNNRREDKCISINSDLWSFSSFYPG